ncbi:PIN domain-containing protein [Rubrobacter aplysinae]|uniref:PIN domain-containing protein n=1 Tax=Rubrobacter aplysinae TaxID=909625 RepID=UPI00064B91C0|nr:PIN domain-containing protein [Rubrobacter aplysinae]
MSAVSNIEGASAVTEQRVFVDTNVLVYAYDLSAGEKHERARKMVEELWRTRTGCISVQVLQEFFVNVTRKIPKPLSTAQAKEIVSDLGHWKMHSPSARDVVEAIDLHERLSLSFWDGMILRSAASLGCTVLYTEDLNTGQSYDGIRTENPFSTP